MAYVIYPVLCECTKLFCPYRRGMYSAMKQLCKHKHIYMVYNTFYLFIWTV